MSSKELDALEMIVVDLTPLAKKHNKEDIEIVKSALERKEKLEFAIRDLFASHIEFVAEKDKCYFKIRNSKGKEKSFTSKTLEDYWKEVFGLGL